MRPAPVPAAATPLMPTLLFVALAAVAAAPAAGAQARGVLVIGDSLEVGTSPYLSRYLPGRPVRVDADESRSSRTAVEVLRERLLPTDAVVVFDAGVNNDPSQAGVLAGDLAAVDELIGDRCLVLATINRPDHNGISHAGLNSVLARFAAQRPNTHLIDWSAFALGHPDLFHSDAVHPTATGYSIRARLIAQGIEACLAGAPPAVASPPQAQPLYRPAPSVDRRALRDARRRAIEARELAMAYLLRAHELSRAPGDVAATFLLGLAAIVPSSPVDAARPARSRPRRSR